jgi:hypothetical protein
MVARMKIWLALVAACGLAISVMAAQPAPKGGAGKTAPGKAAGKEEEKPKIDGQEVARAGGGYLGVQIANGSFKINFYDGEKKPVAPNVARALLRWDPKNKLGQERLVLNPSGPNSLVGNKPVKPPYTFKLFIVLIKDAAGESAENPAGESYVIDFRG